ncbi:tetratricopeptide repeat protein [Bacteroidota bacterium]
MKKVVFFLIIFTFISVNAQSLQVTQLDKEIIHQLFDGNWPLSDSLIDTEIANNPENPKYYFMKSYAAFYSRMFSNDALSRDETIRVVTHYAWETIKLGENLPGNIENNFYLGAAYAFLARANIMNRDYWNAYWNASESEDYFEDVLDEDPTIYDAYLNMGAAEYFEDFAITGFQSFLAWLGGMSGDKETGIEYITKTATQGNLFADEAKFALALIYRVGENDYTTALSYWRQLHNKYPNSEATENAFNQAVLVEKINTEGTDFLETEIDSIQTKYNVNNAFVLNTAGYSLINQGKLNDALKVFQINIELYPTVANCYDSLAECYMNMGDNENAVKYYRVAYNQLDADDSLNDEARQTNRERITGQLSELGASVGS